MLYRKLHHDGVIDQGSGRMLRPAWCTLPRGSRAAPGAFASAARFRLNRARTEVDAGRPACRLGSMSSGSCRSDKGLRSQ